VKCEEYEETVIKEESDGVGIPAAFAPLEVKKSTLLSVPVYIPE